MAQKVRNIELIYKENDLPLNSTRRIATFENSKGSVIGGNRAYVKIPNSRNSFLDTADAYITFSVESTLVGTVLPWNNAGTMTNLTQVYLSATGASSFIQSIEILQNNALVARVDNADKINACLSVANDSFSSQNPKGVVDGSSQEVLGTLVGNQVCETWGYPIGLTGTATKSYLPKLTFCINNNILSCLGDGNLLPLGWLKGGIELQIEFKSDSRNSYVAKYGSTITSATSVFTNVNYVCPIIELDQSSYDAVVSDNNFGKDNVMWSSVNHHASVIQWSVADQDAVGEYTILVPNNRFTSLKNIILGSFMSPTTIGDFDLCVPNIPVDTLMYRMNGRQYPQTRINTLPKALNNTVACYSSNSNSVGTTLMNSTNTSMNYRQAVIGGTITSVERGVIGLNLEAWAESDALSGLDVSQSDTEALLGSDGGTAVSQAQLCFVSSYDTVYVISPEGVLSSSYS
jgi:hypothetical protein